MWAPKADAVLCQAADASAHSRILGRHLGCSRFHEHSPLTEAGYPKTRLAAKVQPRKQGSPMAFFVIQDQAG